MRQVRGNHPLYLIISFDQSSSTVQCSSEVGICRHLELLKYTTIRAVKCFSGVGIGFCRHLELQTCCPHRENSSFNLSTNPSAADIVSLTEPNLSSISAASLVFLLSWSFNLDTVLSTSFSPSLSSPIWSSAILSLLKMRRKLKMNFVCFYCNTYIANNRYVP